MPKYLMQSDRSKQLLLETVQYLVRAISKSSIKLGRDVKDVSAVFDVEGTRYQLTFTKLGTVTHDETIQEQASGGVQSGGS